MTAIINLSEPIQRGDSFAFEFNWDDGDPVSPAPIDMRERDVILSFKLSNLMPDSQALVSVTETTASDDVDAQNGKVVVSVPREESAKLVAGATHYYACRVLEYGDGDTVEITHVAGSVLVVDA